MPTPGPVYISPPIAVRPRSANWVRHQPVACTKAKALATPAPRRSAGHSAGQGSAIAAVSAAVASRPARITDSDPVALAWCVPPPRRSRSGRLQASAPSR